MAPEFPIRKNNIIMDNKLIRQFGEDILCYRIPTERQKKRKKYKAFDKHLLRLHREEKSLIIQQQNLGWEPLDPPVQKGWKRFFVLRDDVATSKHADFFANILSKINTCDWHYRKNFLVKRRFRGRKKYVVKPQKLLSPASWQFSQLDFTDAEKAYFYLEYRYERRRHNPQVYYVFREPWRFVLRVRPNIIDKVMKRDVVIEARIKRIDRYLEINDYRNRQIRLVYGYHWNSWDKGEREKNPYKQMTVGRIVAETGEEV
jgi:hypothetical protein